MLSFDVVCFIQSHIASFVNRLSTVVDNCAVTGERAGMAGDGLERLFEELERQAEGLALTERDADVGEQRRAEYAEVDLAARLHASAGGRLTLVVGGVGPLEGRLQRVGAGWLLLEDRGGDWVVALSAVTVVRGLADRAMAAEARSVLSRLSLGAALRRLAERRAEVAVHLVDGTVTHGLLGRVGADFVERRVGEPGQGGVEAVPFTAIAAVRCG